MLGAQLMIILDATVVNIALPHIQSGLRFSPTSLSWVMNGYTLTFGGLLLLGGRAGDILGRRRMFIAGITIFTLASLAGGLATSAGMLIAARAVQGAGGALASPAVLALVVSGFAEGKERTRALAIYVGVVTGGSSLGLVLGGLITEWLSWRWVLFINVPIGIARRRAHAAVRVRDAAPARPVRLDRRGHLHGRRRPARLRVHPRRLRRLGQPHWRWPSFGVAIVLLAAFLVTETRASAADHAAAAVRRRQPVRLVRGAAAAGGGHVRDVLLPHPVPAGRAGLQPAAHAAWRSCR